MITVGKYKIIDKNVGTVLQMNVKSINRKNGTLIADWFMVKANEKPYTIRNRNDDISSIQDLFNNSDCVIEKMDYFDMEEDLFRV